MSEANLSATISTLNASKIKYKVLTSPYTGQLTAYTQATSPILTNHSEMGRLDVFAQQITIQYGAQGLDGFCDKVAYLGGITQDTYYPESWVATTATADGSLAMLATTGELILPGTAGLLIGKALYTIVSSSAILGLIFFIVLVIIIVIAIYLLIQSQKQSVTWTDANGNTHTGAPSDYITSQNGEYWFVCDKDGYAVGKRSQYAKPSDVPQADVTIFNEHCSTAEDIFAGGGMPSWIWWIITPVIVIAGAYIAVKIVPPLVKSRTPPSP